MFATSTTQAETLETKLGNNNPLLRLIAEVEQFLNQYKTGDIYPWLLRKVCLLTRKPERNEQVEEYYRKFYTLRGFIYVGDYDLVKVLLDKLLHKAENRSRRENSLLHSKVRYYTILLIQMMPKFMRKNATGPSEAYLQSKITELEKKIQVSREECKKQEVLLCEERNALKRKIENSKENIKAKDLENKTLEQEAQFLREQKKIANEALEKLNQDQKDQKQAWEKEKKKQAQDREEQKRALEKKIDQQKQGTIEQMQILEKEKENQSQRRKEEEEWEKDTQAWEDEEQEWEKEKQEWGKEDQEKEEDEEIMNKMNEIKEEIGRMMGTQIPMMEPEGEEKLVKTGSPSSILVTDGIRNVPLNQDSAEVTNAKLLADSSEQAPTLPQDSIQDALRRIEPVSTVLSTNQSCLLVSSQTVAVQDTSQTLPSFSYTS